MTTFRRIPQRITQRISQRISMTRFRFLLLPLLLLTALAAGCAGIGGPPPDINYYALEYDPPVIDARGVFPFVLRVDRFGISPFYDSNRIVYRDADFRRDAYIYHRWWANPAEMVPHFLARDLEATGRFRSVFVFDRNLPATHVIEGTVETFYERDEPGKWWAVLTLRIALIEADEPDVSRRILFQRSYTEQEPCERKTPRALAAAMSGAMARASKAIVGDIHRRLQKTADADPEGGASMP